MRSVEERTAAVTARILELNCRQERRRLSGLTALSALLLTALVAVIGLFDGGGHVPSVSELTGSSLLSENAGGYVLVALLSFAAAVLITTLCFRLRKKREDQKREEVSRQAKEETT